MSAVTLDSPKVVHYPDSDGAPIAENTLQFRWIMTIQGNLDNLFKNDTRVFVAGDHLIYPVEGNNTIRQAPDVYVAFGRPKGDRGSYKVWEEGDIFPQVIFEVLSPGNRPTEMARKFLFYELYGAEEYYEIDPDRNTVLGFRRVGNDLVRSGTRTELVSPRLGIRFDTSGPTVEIYGPDGKRFLSYVELCVQTEREKQRAEMAEKTIERLAAKLRELGVDPDSV